MDLDVMDVMQIILGVDAVMPDQALEGDAVIRPILPPQTVDIGGGDTDYIGHVPVDPDIDQGEEFTFRMIKGIVEIEKYSVHKKIESGHQGTKKIKTCPLSCHSDVNASAKNETGSFVIPAKAGIQYSTI